MRKTLLIIAVLLVFVFGIFGIPKGIGLSAWKTALTDRIHLGLDLKGGIHLVRTCSRADSPLARC